MEIAYPEKYYKKVQEKFPHMSLKEIDCIVKYGLRSIFIHCGYGGDVCITTTDFGMYIGRIIVDAFKFFKYRTIKHAIKVRIRHKRSKVKWDGYYYFGISKEQFTKIFGKVKNPSQVCKRVFENVKGYKLLEECKLHHYSHVFRIKYPMDVGYTFFRKTYETNRAEYILKRVNGKWIDLNPKPWIGKRYKIFAYRKKFKY